MNGNARKDELGRPKLGAQVPVQIVLQPGRLSFPSGSRNS